MTPEILLMSALLVLTLLIFVKDVFPIEVTALGLLAVLTIVGLVPPDQVFLGFSNKAVVAIGSLFVLSRALVKTGVLEAAGERLCHRFRRKRWLAVALFLAGAAVLSGFLNNTAVVAVFIPLTLDLCRRLDLSPGKLLMPLSYAAIFGGTLTLIGTSTNLLVSAIAEDAGAAPLGMFELGKLGIVFLVLGLGYLVVFAPRWLPSRGERSSTLTQKYSMSGYLTEVRVQADSKLVGQSCREARVAGRYDVSVLAILRGEQRIALGLSTVPLKEGDVLIAQGRLESLVRLRNEQGVALLPDVKLQVSELSSDESVVMEGLIPLGSALVGRTLRDLDFRRSYGAFVLAIRRLGTTIREKIARVALHPADTLLMLVPREGLTALHESRDLILLSEHELELRRGRFWWLILVVLPAAVLLAALGVVDIAVSAMLATILLLLARTITPQEAYRSIEWSVLFLIAAFIPVGHAIVETGTAGFLASGLVAAASLLPPEIGPYLALSLTYLATSLLTQMISNNAAAIIVAPLAFTLAVDLGVDARPFLVAVAFAASAEFMTPMGYQTNMMVYGPGGYRFLDYTKFGAPLNLSFWLLSTLLIPLLWPF